MSESNHRSDEASVSISTQLADDSIIAARSTLSARRRSIYCVSVYCVGQSLHLCLSRSADRGMACPLSVSLTGDHSDRDAAVRRYNSRRPVVVWSRRRDSEVGRQAAASAVSRCNRTRNKTDIGHDTERSKLHTENRGVVDRRYPIVAESCIIHYSIS